MNTSAWWIWFPSWTKTASLIITSARNRSLRWPTEVLEVALVAPLKWASNIRWLLRLAKLIKMRHAKTFRTWSGIFPWFTKNSQRRASNRRTWCSLVRQTARSSARPAFLCPLSKLQVGRRFQLARKPSTLSLNLRKKPLPRPAICLLRKRGRRRAAPNIPATSISLKRTYSSLIRAVAMTKDRTKRFIWRSLTPTWLNSYSWIKIRRERHL